MVSDARRTLEERKRELDILRSHLRQGDEQAMAGQCVEDLPWKGN